MSLKPMPVPLGKDSNDPGDCENPRSLVLHLHEDRWGNHVVVVLQDNKEKHRGLITHRGTEVTLRRKPFSADADVLRRILLEVESG
jgi:hypothetical protein